MKKLLLFIIFNHILFGEDFINYSVIKGDTISKICKNKLQDPKRWREVLEFNSIKSVNLILPGTVLKIQTSLLKTEKIILLETIAKIKEKEGLLKLKNNKNEDWIEIEKDKNLIEEDLIRTGSNSKAEVEFTKTPLSLIILDELTIMKIKKDTQRTIELKSGGANIKTQTSLDSKNSLKVNTNSSVCIINGEEAEIFTNDKKANYASYKGDLDVSAQSQTVKVPEGFGTYVITGQAPTKPFKILEKVSIKPIIRN